MSGDGDFEIMPDGSVRLDLAHAISDLSQRWDLITPAHLPVVIEYLEARGVDLCLHTRQIEMDLRTLGEPLALELKRYLGLRGNVKIGDRYALMLAAGGRADPVATAVALVARARGAVWRARSFESAIQSDWPLYASETPHSCAAACAVQSKALDGKLYTIADAPRFPLAACDQMICRCSVFAHFVPRRRHHATFPRSAGDAAATPSTTAKVSSRWSRFISRLAAALGG